MNWFKRRIGWYLFLILVLFTLTASCTRSQFSTTTRYIRNGKVTYVNHHAADRIKTVRADVPGSGLNKHTDPEGPPVTVFSDAQEPPGPEIPAITPAGTSGDENYLASASDEAVILTVNDNHDVQKEERAARQKITRGSAKAHGDPFTATTKPPPGKTSSAKSPASHKIDAKSLLGLIFSIMGFIPMAGIIFSILGLVFSGVSLRQYNTGSRYVSEKSRKIALAGLIIGIASLLFNIILCIYLVATMDFPMNISMGGW